MAASSLPLKAFVLLLSSLLLCTIDATRLFRRKAQVIRYPGVLWHRMVSNRMYPNQVVPFNGTLAATGKARASFNVYKYNGDYVIRVHAWAKNLQHKPAFIVVGDGFGGQPSIPLVNFTGTWRLKGDGPRLLLTVFINNAKTTLVPGSPITYQQLFQNVNGGGGRYNVQLVEDGSDQPTMRGAIYKGFPWSLSPLNIP